MMNIRNSQSVIAGLLFLVWLSHSVYLSPLPPERIEEVSRPSGTEDMVDVPEERENSRAKPWGAVAERIWLEWLIALSATVGGCLAGGLWLVNRKLGGALAGITSLWYLGRWVERSARSGSEFFALVPPEGVIEGLIERWKAARYLDMSGGGAWQQAYFWYFDVVVAGFHMTVLAGLCVFVVLRFGRVGRQ